MHIVCFSVSVHSYVNNFLSKIFNIFRRHPNGTEINEVTNPTKENEKIYVENNKITSKLVIQNLELRDSGRYKLFADNEKYSQNINVTLFVEGK